MALHSTTSHTYYVTGVDAVTGEPRTVKTEARSKTEARDNASWILRTIHRAVRWDAA